MNMRLRNMHMRMRMCIRGSRRRSSSEMIRLSEVVRDSLRGSTTSQSSREMAARLREAAPRRRRMSPLYLLWSNSSSSSNNRSFSRSLTCLPKCYLTDILVVSYML